MSQTLAVCLYQSESSYFIYVSIFLSLSLSPFSLPYLSSSLSPLSRSCLILPHSAPLSSLLTCPRNCEQKGQIIDRRFRCRHGDHSGVSAAVSWRWLTPAPARVAILEKTFLRFSSRRLSPGVRRLTVSFGRIGTCLKALIAGRIKTERRKPGSNRKQHSPLVAVEATVRRRPSNFQLMNSGPVTATGRGRWGANDDFPTNLF